MTTTMTSKDAALHYVRKYRFSVIPCRADKKPCLASWKEYQTRLPSEDEIETWWTQWPDANVAIVTGKLSGITVVDVDTEDAQKNLFSLLAPEELDTPMVKTPKGQHRYYKHADVPTKARVMEGIDFRSEGGYVLAPPSVVNGKQYLWVASMGIEQRPMRAFPHKLALEGGIRGEPLPYSKNISSYTDVSDKAPDAGPEMFSYGRRDEDLFRVANCLTKGGMSTDEKRQALVFIMKGWGEDPDPKWIEAKIKSAEKRHFGGEKRNVSEIVLEFIDISDSDFSVSELVRYVEKYLSLSPASPNVSNVSRAVRCALSDFKKGGLIENIGRGWYRKVDKESSRVIRLFDPEVSRAKPLPLRWPLGVEKLVHLYPKEIVVLAGDGNVGKTAFMLNAACMNWEVFRVVYISTEMGAVSLSQRVRKFPNPESWRKAEESGRLTVVEMLKHRPIQSIPEFDPDGLVIVDYLELGGDDYPRVAEIIREIYNKIGTGIVCIAMQKRKGSKEARGGDLTKEKARIYLSMDVNTLEIVKGKVPAGDRNPNGLVRDFLLRDGWEFSPLSAWDYRPEEMKYKASGG